mmetsp:Transcript_37197/g.74070  ORF Transcript_37197/g.74070 Transcript_37197/m.74070 type:complete len:237 (+) Transcript_37197:220-930(+)
MDCAGRTVRLRCILHFLRPPGARGGVAPRSCPHASSHRVAIRPSGLDDLARADGALGGRALCLLFHPRRRRAENLRGFAVDHGCSGTRRLCRPLRDRRRVGALRRNALLDFRRLQSEVFRFRQSLALRRGRRRLRVLARCLVLRVGSRPDVRHHLVLDLLEPVGGHPFAGPARLLGRRRRHAGVDDVRCAAAVLLLDLPRRREAFEHLLAWQGRPSHGVVVRRHRRCHLSGRGRRQ